MSQSTTMPAPALPPAQTRPAGQPGSVDAAPAHDAPPTPVERLRRQASSAMQGTPGRLRVLAAVLVLAAVVFGLGAAQAFRSAHGALERAEHNTSQLVRVQSIHTSLVRADANVTNAFLVGGIEPAEQRSDYEAAIAEATRLVAAASRAQPADANALAELNSQIVAYTGLVERARSNNRQGLPVGAQYLRDASAAFSADSLPILDALVKSNEERVQTEFDASSRSTLILLLVGVLALGAVLAGSWWLARRTHRLINVPLVAGGAAILLTFGAGLVGLSGTNGTVGEIRDGAYSWTLAAAKARIAAFDAKSNESLTLIARGSGAAFEKGWQESSAEVLRESGAVDDHAAGLARTWGAYSSAHAAVRAADDGGNWDQAVRLAIDKKAPSSPNVAFAAFDDASAKALAEASALTTDGLSGTRGWLPVAAVLALVLSALAAALAWWGVSQRLEEYR